MAEIPIEKKSNLSWLWWLLLLAGILALLLYLFSRGDDDADQVVQDDNVPAAIADPGDDGLAADGADGEAITDLAMIANTSDGSLEGRNVALTGVRAGSVPEDAGFWLDAGNDKRVWVVLEEVRTPNTPIEGRVDVDEGDMVDVTGVIRSAADGAPEGAAIPGPTAPLPDGVDHFIYASKVVQSAS